MKEIKLSQRGKNKNKFIALIDDEDFERVNQFKWFVRKGRNTFYAAKNIWVNGKRKIQWMHDFIIGTIGIDHSDHNGLNNQRSNIRSCTNSQNQMNKRSRLNSSSIYKGVCWHKMGNKWGAYITIEHQRIHLGLFADGIKAANAYNLKAKELFGEFAFLNTI